jgi:uncharacterized protein YecE (DUF72 family)
MQRVGTAGWSLPRKPKSEGSHLYHYSRELSCTEINSTFYRPHRASTWVRWAAETPPDFRFSIKAPRSITHEAKLRDTEPLVKAFLEQIQPIQAKAGPVLFQLPPSLGFDPVLAEEFLAMLRDLYQGEAALEPRHAGWFTPKADALLSSHEIARVGADPPKGAPEAAGPGGNLSLVYHRLHGAPRVYYSNYEDSFLATRAAGIHAHKNVWIIFDNTALSHAYPNALRFQKLIISSNGEQSDQEKAIDCGSTKGPASDLNQKR